MENTEHRAVTPYGAQLDPAHDEWTTWLTVGQEFKNCGIDINDVAVDGLIRAIEWWGEELALLRSHQSAQVADDALREKRRNYRRIT